MYKNNYNVNVFIHISAQEGSFKLSRLLPEKNNVRSEWFFNEEKSNMSFCFFFLIYILCIYTYIRVAPMDNSKGAKYTRKSIYKNFD